jgi:AcrR family transcriptional regulator
MLEAEVRAMARGSTREEILSAAAGLFAADGYKGTSLQDIAAAVGCSKATLLYHFATKEMILATLLAPPVRDLVTLTEQVAGRPAAEAQQQAIEGFVDLVLNYRREIALIFHDLAFLFNESSFADLRDLTDVLGAALAGGAKDPAALVKARVMMAGIALITVDPVEGVDVRAVLIDVARRALVQRA